MPPYDRSHSVLQMTSPLGEDVLIPTTVSGHEEISQAYSYQVRMVSTQANIDPDRLLHQPGCVILRRDTDPARYFHGIFQAFTAGGQPRPDMYAYHAVLVPKFWFLGQTIDCRVFQDKTVVQILQQMLDDAGVTSSDFRIYGDRPVRPYTVQFNETDLQFATRLMQQSGYFYFFEHAADQHTLVVADSNDAFKDIPDSTLRFNAQVRGGEDVLADWHKPRATTYGKVTLKDYDATQPSKVLQATEQGDQQVAGAPSRDVFLWAAETVQGDVVSYRGKMMIEAAEAAQALVSGTGSFRSMTVGGRFTLEQDPVSGQPAVIHAVQSMDFQVNDDSWSNDGGPSSYTNRFQSLPASTSWRDPMSAQRPRMSGIYTAIVLGPGGEEIYTDDLARVKVRFPWDWRSEATAEQGFWARVMQSWTGNGWGAQFIPRVGTEVAVGFENGDPDHPIVLGGLYNGEQAPIFSVGDKTKSGVRTRSSKGGGASDFNELSFDDSTGAEAVNLLAQKDMSVQAKHDQQVLVGHDRTVHVSNAERITVDNGRTTTISSGNDQLTVQTGDLSISVSMGKVTVTAMQSIELTVGASSVKIDPAGVTISGMTINISGDGSVSLSAPMTSLSADGNMAISGGLVEIN